MATLLDIVLLGGPVLILMEVAGWRRAPVTPGFLAAMVVTSFFTKVIFELRDGLFHWLGAAARGSTAQWDKAIFGRLYRRRAQFAIVGVAIMLGLALLEVALRTSLRVLPVGLANGLARPYSTFNDGIYRRDLNLGLVRMRSHYRRKMYFNGYIWTHQTDALGFRNPMELTQADIVFLGDSMVYGHGVEETQTIASYLRTLTNRSVANLGQQGSGMHEEYQFLLHFGRPLRPKWVLLFVLNNDISDTLYSLTQQEQERFLEIPDGRFEDSYMEQKATSKRLSLSTTPRAWHSLQGWTNTFYVVRATDFAFKALTKKRITSLHPRVPPPIENSGPVPSPSTSPAAGATTAPELTNDAEPLLRGEPFVSEPELLLSYRFQAKGFRQMQRLALHDGFEFAVIYFGTNQPFDEVFDALFQQSCLADGITYVSLRDYYRQRETEGADLFLKNDGHLSATGARATAEELLRLFPQLKANPQGAPSR